ncbi:hypothetical protein D3C76_1209830 [compost metagenome]
MRWIASFGIFSSSFRKVEKPVDGIFSTKFPPSSRLVLFSENWRMYPPDRVTRLRISAWASA